MVRKMLLFINPIVQIIHCILVNDGSLLFLCRNQQREFFLEITNIRVERLNDISEEDAIKEGVIKIFNSLFNEWRFKDYANIKSDWRSAVSSFQSLWASINGIGSWDKNPYVWVIEFKQVEKPLNF